MFRVTVDEMTAGNVRAELGRSKVRQKDIAQSLHLSEAQVSQRVRGRVPWSVSELYVIAGLIGVPVRRLLPAQATKAA